MSPKVITLCMVALLFFYTLTYATARLESTFSGINAATTAAHRHAEQLHKVMVEESCEGAGEDECLERRTLAAQLDYIYTLKTKP
ncbi:Phytosulfokines 3 [Morella rubra]|uniref:Phytosulfokine n=1 Tax=Morella rubra TaxID=262757 RepID=A0A6A1V6W7_9ROSI|nr:Phytosulfokines 3 [Morella rubra]KAB1208592.1 Phytosulfokines 3 [Morella rubra]